MGFVEKSTPDEVFVPELTPSQKILQFVWDLVKVVLVSLLIIVPVRYFLIQPFYVKGASMEPSFFDHEYLIINEIKYQITTPQRGDIIVFKYPKDPSQFFIKRIIGVPGETVDIEDNKVFVNTVEGKRLMLDESAYLGAEVPTRGGATNWTLGASEYFVMGDNRDFSLDSRSFGPVPVGNIVGQVWLRGWPVWRMTMFREVDYKIQ